MAGDGNREGCTWRVEIQESEVGLVEKRMGDLVESTTRDLVESRMGDLAESRKRNMDESRRGDLAVCWPVEVLQHAGII